MYKDFLCGAEKKRSNVPLERNIATMDSTVAVRSQHLPSTHLKIV